MAVPALPTALDTDDIVDNDQVDDIRAMLEFFRETKPYFKGRARATAASSTNEWTVASATTTVFGLGSSGSIHYPSDATNIGGWTVNGVDANPESLVVPETGRYRITMWINFSGNTAGRRQIALLVDGSVPEVDARTRRAPSPVSTTSFSHTVDVYLTAGQELDIQVFQDSGSTLDCEVWLTAEFILAA